MIYLDYAAATPVSKQVRAAMAPFFSDNFFNPSAPYLPAKRVREIYEAAKDQLAHTIGAKGNDLIITAGATESINLAFTAAPANSRILILATEHAAVRAAAYRTSQPVTEIKVNRDGLIDLQDFKNQLRADVSFVSISLANNELGTIQPIAEIAELIRAERQTRLKNQHPLPIFFHSDASQALHLLDINVARLGVDLLTINAAKVYGPKGVGALYCSHDAALQPIVVGGGQERGLRSGTENVPGLIGFAAAAKFAKAHLSSNRQKYLELIKILRAELQNARVKPIFLGTSKHQLANFCPVSFPGLDAERLIYLLEDQEIYLATGAACAASKGEKSPVLTAIGLNDSEIAGSLRISLGQANSPEDIHAAATAIVAAVNLELKRLEESA